MDDRTDIGEELDRSVETELIWFYYDHLDDLVSSTRDWYWDVVQYRIYSAFGGGRGRRGLAFQEILEYTLEPLLADSPLGDIDPAVIAMFHWILGDMVDQKLIDIFIQPDTNQLVYRVNGRGVYHSLLLKNSLVDSFMNRRHKRW